MTSQTVYHSFLTVHITGFVLFAGTTIAGFTAISRFWKQYACNGREAVSALDAITKFPILQRIGVGLLILSGVGMMALTRGVFGEQFWFRVKFALLILLILNLLLTGRKLVLQLRNAVSTDAFPYEKTMQIKTRLRLFYNVQLFFLFMILLLSVFKFN